MNEEELAERIAERLGKAPTQVKSRQQDLPVDTTLALSSSKCSLSGNAPFTVTIRETCKTDRPIWALVFLNTPFSYGIEVRDPARNYRKIGPPTDFVDDDDDEGLEEERELDDSKLSRLAPGEDCVLFFTFSTEPRAGGLRNSDMRSITSGNTYAITLGQRQWRWMFEDEMPSGLTEDDRKVILRTKRPMLWKADCIESFEATT